MVGKKARKIYDVDSMIKISVTVSFFEAEKSLLFLTYLYTCHIALY